MLRPGPLQLGFRCPDLTVTLSMELCPRFWVLDKDMRPGKAQKGTWLFRITHWEPRPKDQGPFGSDFYFFIARLLSLFP